MSGGQGYQSPLTRKKARHIRYLYYERGYTASEIGRSMEMSRNRILEVLRNQVFEEDYAKAGWLDRPVAEII